MALGLVVWPVLGPSNWINDLPLTYKGKEVAAFQKNCPYRYFGVTGGQKIARIAHKPVAVCAEQDPRGLASFYGENR
jgi:hypothetical protein